MQRVPGVIVADKYRLEDVIGRGGMGEVWRAFDRSLERTVALKFIGAEVAEGATARARFAAEAKTAARLQSPHVVAIYEHGVVDDTPFIAMELLEGEDLRARLKRRRRLTPPEVCAVVSPVAQALRLAHAAGIVHRDLKPENVFLARSGDDETVKLLDFGVAHVEAAHARRLTATGEMVGSVSYMSPEQIRSHRGIDARADTWSLGVIAYRALTGRLPFRGKGMGEVAVSICTADAAPPSATRPELPAALDAFFVRALARDRDARFSTAVGLAEALAAACGVTGTWSGQPPSSSGPHHPRVPADARRATLGYVAPPPSAARAPARATMAYAAPGAASEPDDTTPTTVRTGLEPENATLVSAGVEADDGARAATRVVSPAPPPSSAEAAAAIPDLDLPRAPPRSAAPMLRPASAMPASPATMTVPSTGAAASRVRPAGSPGLRSPLMSMPVARPLAPAVTAGRARAARENAAGGIDPRRIRLLLGAGCAVALVVAAVGPGPGGAVAAALAVSTLLVAGLVWRFASDGGPARGAAVAMLVVALTTAGRATSTMVAALDDVPLDAVGAVAAVFVPLGLTVAAARTVREELTRQLSQGVLVVVAILVGIAATTHLGRRAIEMTERPETTTPERP
ncbi:MAG: serine/threonine-protein kinase [Myxococcota bacterium]